jgi:alanine dehydrogenase
MMHFFYYIVSMLIGLPKEIKSQEHRVGLVPASVRELTAAGHEVLVETGAGEGIQFSDQDYIDAGAKIIPDVEDIFAKCEMIVKVKEPQPREYEQLREDQILFTYLHLAADKPQAEGLMESGCVAIAYETVTDKQGSLPLLTPMSEVAGRLATQVGAYYLQKHQGGMGRLIGGVPGVSPAKVTIIGGGVSGFNAAEMAVGLQADVTILDRSHEKLRFLNQHFGNQAIVEYSNADTIENAVKNSDLVIGAVLIPGASAPKLVKKDWLKDMPGGSVLVDIAIDQGGCFETSKATTHQDPVYIIDGVVHYCVANMPGAVPLTSALALNNATLPYVLELANKGWKPALADNPGLMNGLNVCQGKITHQGVAESLGINNYHAPDKMVA